MGMIGGRANELEYPPFAPLTPPSGGPLVFSCPKCFYNMYVRMCVPAHRMLLRQHQSIDSLTEVVKTQANTIAGLVSLLGAAGTTAATAAAAGMTAGERRTTTRATGESPTAGPRIGAGFGDDEDAIAEMVAYLDDVKAPNPAVSAATAAGKV